MDSIPPSGARSSTGAAIFLVLTLAGTWLLQIPALLAREGWLPGDPRFYMPFAGLGLFVPMAVAIWLTARTEGKAGVRALLGRLLLGRVSVVWYVVALLLPGALLAGGLGLLNLAGREGAVIFNRGAGALVFGVFISVGEEVGWRGYALPRLQAKLGPIAASGVIGVVWTIWHIPMFIGLGVPLSLLLVMLLIFVGGSLTFTWIYQRTGGSLLLAVLAHLGCHWNNSHAALPGEVLPLVVHSIIYAAIGVAAVVFDRKAFPELSQLAGRARLSRSW